MSCDYCGDSCGPTCSYTQPKATMNETKVKCRSCDDTGVTDYNHLCRCGRAPTAKVLAAVAEWAAEKMEADRYEKMRKLVYPKLAEAAGKGLTHVAVSDRLGERLTRELANLGYAVDPDGDDGDTYIRF